MSSNHLITVLGPTAIGKTALAIKIAGHFKTEIISADSRQFFTEMAIGTAVPEAEELSETRHHFIQHISIEDAYSVGDFEREAIKKLEDLFKKNPVAVMVGGSGLYIKSIVEGLDDFPEIDLEIRKNLNELYEARGLAPLQQQLKALDPEYFEKADIQNKHRVIRALEICLGTHKTYSSFLNRKKPQRNFETINIGLTAEREVIYDRINKRVDIMMKKGLLDEARALYPQRHLNALNTVGYKELFAYLEGEIDLETAVSEIKKNTRRFAKRQLTWFRKQQDIFWFDYKTPPEEILRFIKERLS